MNLQNLHAPFPPNEIEWRVGSTKADKSSGLALAYLTARHVMERLDEVCGVGNWQDRYEFHGKRTVCYLSIRIGEEWVTKADGAGDSDVEAEKGAISDALKRAAVKWGVGRYLYSLGNTWVDLEAAGKSVRIKKTEFAKLAKMMEAKFGLPPSDMGDVNLAAAEAVEAEEQAALVSARHKIRDAQNTDECQSAFGEAWKQFTDDEGRRQLKAEYDARKAALGTSRVDPNAQFDQMARESEPA
ncbi:Rad52/Rad22 family DNA repair protein [Devosia sp. 2618]|uniref:Rad52/Rad22 family DNA repair protein n=1 Tax=Devosia sp. 2618 TaxID=3156454 RepID=UPI00339315D7